MNKAQRNWLAASLIVVGLSLSGSAFEWDQRSYSEPVISLKKRYDLQENRIEEVGIFVRKRWVFNNSILGTGIFIWGGVLPLCLFAASGFVLLGDRE